MLYCKKASRRTAFYNRLERRGKSGPYPPFRPPWQTASIRVRMRAMAFPTREQAVRFVGNPSPRGPIVWVNAGRSFLWRTSMLRPARRPSMCLNVCPAGGTWRPDREGNIGKGGFAPPGEKREGDGRTPSGLFGLGCAFGYPPSVDTGMSYRRTGKTTFG